MTQLKFYTYIEIITNFRLTCGLAGALFVYTHRKIVDFHQHHKQNKFNRFLEKR